MDEVLRLLDGSQVPSKQWPGARGVLYSVVVVPGRHVTLGHEVREPSVLPWDQIELVYNAARAGMELTNDNVDNLLRDHPAGHSASTMCALVLAMLNPTRAQHVGDEDPSAGKTVQG
jgi:hypothetical protein